MQEMEQKRHLYLEPEAEERKIGEFDRRHNESTSGGWEEALIKLRNELV